MSEEKLEESLEVISSELSFIGEKLTEISKYMKKSVNWTDADEEKYGDKEEEDDEEDDEDDKEDEG